MGIKKVEVSVKGYELSLWKLVAGGDVNVVREGSFPASQAEVLIPNAVGMVRHGLSLTVYWAIT